MWNSRFPLFAMSRHSARYYFGEITVQVPASVITESGGIVQIGAAPRSGAWVSLPRTPNDVVFRREADWARARKHRGYLAGTL